MKKMILLAAACLCLLAGTTPAGAAEGISKRPLSEVFHHLVIVPYDYQGKAFISGQMEDVYGDYEMVQRDGRVLVPIRLMSYLATQADGNNSYWDAVWQPEQPDMVRLINHRTQKTVIFTVNSHTILVNNEPHIMDVAPQKVNGSIMLPLRSAAEALDQHIDWLNGLILIGSDYVDLQHPQTTALIDAVKKQLTDPRERMDDGRKLEPAAQYGDKLFYFKTLVDSEQYRRLLYAKLPGGKELPITLTGQPLLQYTAMLDDEMYYITIQNGETELHVYSFAEGTSHKVSGIRDWKPGDGWFTGVEELDNELYVTLHTGDNIMGGDTVYKVVDGSLQKVTSAKSLIRLIQEGDKLYFTDFLFMQDFANNLKQMDLKSGDTVRIGVEGYAYGASRYAHDDGSVSYSGNRSLYVRDGHLYAVAYHVDDSRDRSAVYKLNLADQTQVQLTPPADQFWIAGKNLYYREFETGHLAVTDLNGGVQRTLVERPILGAQFIGGSIYYTSNASRDAYKPGVLYRLDLADEEEIRLSDLAVSSYFAGESGIYYVSHSYAPGIYKIGADGRHAHLVSDHIDSAILTDEGLVYTLKYEEGIYTVK
ncbi:DUF5050 domain-containing protein [Xylanibacillus composti]|uniref:DUF5050 domain-containing protein n=1 Tax=Xylanibacillus composti TaxID=1572762 RepID=A0A8J4M4X7_9BACL|nr:DUF5050 domain-containing protein [Xylanibacillus composti]GIQ71346.1 DUF5050 domain-containing protein [Xylanibacillus composti]